MSATNCLCVCLVVWLFHGLRQRSIRASCASHTWGCVTYLHHHERQPAPILRLVRRASHPRVWSPKVAAWQRVSRATSALPLGFSVLFSSVASLLGSAGQANYAACNAALDEAACLSRSRGMATLCVRWGAWAGALWEICAVLKCRHARDAQPLSSMHFSLPSSLSRPKAEAWLRLRRLQARWRNWVWECCSQRPA